MSKYTQEEVAYITQHFQNKTPQEIAQKLGRTTVAIEAKIRKITTAKTNQGEKWTPQDLQFLRQHYATAHNDDLAASLERLSTDIEKMAQNLVLKKDVKQLAENYGELAELDLQHVLDTMPNNPSLSITVRAAHQWASSLSNRNASAHVGRDNFGQLAQWAQTYAYTLQCCKRPIVVVALPNRICLTSRTSQFSIWAE